MAAADTPSLTSSNISPTNTLSNCTTEPPNTNVVDTVTGDIASHSEQQDTRCDEVAQFDSSKLTIDKDCTECNTTRPDPTTSQLIMYLHALSYQVTIVTYIIHTQGVTVILDVMCVILEYLL